MNPAPGMKREISFGIAFWMMASVTKPTMPSTTMSFRLVSFSLISSQAAPTPPLTSATTMSKPVSMAFMIVSPFLPSALTILARICAHEMPSTLRANLPNSSSVSACGM